jgi:hypothetical protein
MLLSPIIGFAQAQSFEGKVVYHNTYKSKIASLNDQQLTSMMGNTQDWYIKDGDYKSETDGTFAKWQLYINKDNKLYSKLANSEAILWNDGAANADSVISVELHSNVVEILGYMCEELVLNCKSGVQKYYFSTKLPIDSKLYLNHKYGNWYSYLSKSNAVPLEMIIETAQLTLISIATEIKRMKLDQAMFVLPTGVRITKSPY